MLRPLSPIETFVWTVDRVAPVNFTTVGLLRGPLSTEALRVGLDAAQARHPLLGVRIEGEPPAFVGDGVGPIPLREQQGEAPSDVTAAAEQELNARLDAEAGPLVRARVVRLGEARAALLLTFHHCVGDGMSGAWLLRDVLTAATTPQALDALAPARDVAPIDARLPAESRGLAGLRRRLTLLSRQTWSMLADGRPVSPRLDREVPFDERRVRVDHRALPAALTQRLLARAREEGTTLHGALSAAIAMAIVADADPGRRGAIAMGSPVNLRGRVTPSPGQAVALNVAMAEFRAHHAAHDGLWSLARAIRGALTADQEAHLPEATLAMLPGLFRLLGDRRVDPSTFGRRYRALAPNTSGLTNLGRLDLPEGYGAVALEAVHFAVNPSCLSDLVATATGWGGEVLLNLCWPSPSLGDDHARALCDDVHRRLHEAAP